MGLSTNTYPYTGGVKQFSATFADGYIEREHVTAYVTGQVDGLGDQVYLTFEWTTDSTITVTSALTVGDEVTVERTVPKTSVLVDLDENGAITREGLSRNNRQALHAVHEVIDGRLEISVLNTVNDLISQVAILSDTSDTIAVDVADLYVKLAAEVAAREYGDGAFGDTYFAGPWDASTGRFPTGRGEFGDQGAVRNNDYFEVSTAGTVDGEDFEVGERIKALVDTPSDTTLAGNWYHPDTSALLAPLTARVVSLEDHAYIDARDFDVLANGVNARDGYEAALIEGASTGKPVKLPAGEILIAGDPLNTALGRGQKVKVFGDGGTRLFVDANLSATSTEILATTLAVDANQFDITITLASVAGIELGDLLYIDTDTPVETGWRYRKQCIRRVAGVVGNVVQLDQALDFWFTTAEQTTVNVYAPGTFCSDGLDWEFNGNVSNNDRKMALRWLVGSRVTNGLMVGQAPGWNANWTDGFKTIGCDDTIYDGMDFEKLRYAPQITSGSRYTQVKNGYVKECRHLDCNNWSQDTLFENLQGIATDGIIQCHPCIRPTWRNCHDSVTRAGLYGIDLRGLGETVENCSTHSVNGANANTNSIVLDSDYAEMAGTFTRRVSGLRAPYSGIRAGQEGLFLVENSYVYSIDESQYTQDHCTISVDDLTRTVVQKPENFDPDTAGPFALGDMRGRTANVPVSAGYRTRTVQSYIDSATTASPVVIETLQKHNLETGDEIEIDGVSGMTELNGNTYAVTVVDDYSVSLGVDGSAYTAYTSGGTIALQTPNTAVTNITSADPAVITAAGHGLSNGDIIWLAGVGGMSEIDRRYFKVVSALANTFAVQTVDGDPIDATGYTAYTSGGIVTRQEVVATVDAATSPQCGIKTGLSLRSVVFSGNENGVEFRRIPLKYRAFAGGNVDQKTRFGTLTVTATSNVGRSVAKHSYAYDAQSGLLDVSDNFSSVPNNSIAATVDFAQRHYIHEVRDDEGAANWLSQVGARHYFTFDVLVDMTSSARFLNEVIVEFDEVVQGGG